MAKIFLYKGGCHTQTSEELICDWRGGGSLKENSIKWVGENIHRPLAGSGNTDDTF